eukprot:TRINITY_DN12934_c0_g1_i1.p1 TRINITY_DN12934_c0_g1~~TRINITY_DN12934_c0_g1_i1.p1  ORF type:complete len:259 (-),score=34.11 TRINITY_DN12934_c0_g1_i1:120-791(-)
MEQVSHACGTFWSPTSDDSIYIRNKIRPFVKDVDLLLVTLFDYFHICVLILIIEAVQWVGFWNMVTLWLWPWGEKSFKYDLVFVFIGIILRFISKKFMNKHWDVKSDWEQQPPTFQWKKKIYKFGAGFLNFLAFLFGWAGMWDIVDVQLVSKSIVRDAIFFSVPIFVALAFELFLSEESLLFYVAYIRSNGWKDGIIQNPVPLSNPSDDRHTVIELQDVEEEE